MTGKTARYMCIICIEGLRSVFAGTPEFDLLLRVFVRKPYHMMVQFVARIWNEQIRINVRTFTTFSVSAHARLSLEGEENMYLHYCTHPGSPYLLKK